MRHSGRKVGTCGAVLKCLNIMPQFRKEHATLFHPVPSSTQSIRMGTAGIKHEWDLDLYGVLLQTGGGKERMTRYFTVSH